MQIPLPTNMVSMGNFLGWEHGAWGRALAPTANDSEPKLLVLVSAELLGLTSHLLPLTPAIPAIPEHIWLLLFQGPPAFSSKSQLPSL